MPAKQNPAYAPLALPKRDALFERIAAEVERLIESGRWKTGEFLPNEIQLAENFHVAQGTVRRALKILVDKGILVRQVGRGTFVADYHHAAENVADRYVRLVPDKNEPKLPALTQVDVFEILPANQCPPLVAGCLELTGNTPVIHIERTHVIPADGRGEVVSFDEHYLNAAVFSRLTRENMARHNDRVLYAFYQNELGVTIVSYDEEIKAALLEEDKCRRFGMASPKPILICSRTAYSLGRQPVEFRIQRGLTDHYHIFVHV